MFITFIDHLLVYYGLFSLYAELYSLSGSASNENKHEQTDIAPRVVNFLLDVT